MSKRHGLGVRGSTPVFFSGITDVFSGWLDFDFSKYGEEERVKIGTDRSALNTHFQVTQRRLLLSLDKLQRNALNAEAKFNQSGFAGLGDACEELAFAADAVLHYLGILSESIGRLVLRIVDATEMDPAALAARVTTADESIRGIGSVKKRLDNHAKKRDDLSALLDAFGKLGISDSWSNDAFQYGKGMRQRIVHYPDLVQISAVQPHGTSHFTVRARIHHLQHARPDIDLLTELELVLAGMCEWLDELEDALVALLQLKQPDIPFCTPVPLDEKPRRTPEHFLYLRLIDGSPPIPPELPHVEPEIA